MKKYIYLDTITMSTISEDDVNFVRERSADRLVPDDHHGAVPDLKNFNTTKIFKTTVAPTTFNFTCPTTVLYEPNIPTQAEKYKNVFDIMTDGRGPPVPIQYHSVINVNKTSTVDVNCSIAGGEYFLWDLPNGDHMETNRSSIVLYLK